VGATIEERIELFAKLSEMLRTEFVDCSSIAVAAARVAQLAHEGNWTRLATHSAPLCDAVLKEARLDALRVDGGYDKHALEACDAGITECECLVAQTGSVCVTTRSSGGRALSVLPPHHIVIAARAQLLPDLTAAYELLAQKYADRYPSFISFITGPSRTGDIERILVLGAHGPKKLTVLLVP
jgi:L-lactate dehydrogenase complex protein LldG